MAPREEIITKVKVYVALEQPDGALMVLDGRAWRYELTSEGDPLRTVLTIDWSTMSKLYAPELPKEAHDGQPAR
jgi:hypothetical protein